MGGQEAALALQSGKCKRPTGRHPGYPNKSCASCCGSSRWVGGRRSAAEAGGVGGVAVVTAKAVALTGAVVSEIEGLVVQHEIVAHEIVLRLPATKGACLADPGCRQPAVGCWGRWPRTRFSATVVSTALSAGSQRR